MKQIFTKADEMELAINYKAARNAFVFLEFASFILSLKKPNVLLMRYSLFNVIKISQTQRHI